MTNFKKLKKLITEYENGSSYEIRDFFLSLKNIAEIELSLHQANLNDFF